MTGIAPERYSAMEFRGEPLQVLVLGAGFGGLEFCKHFKHPHARISLVDRTNHHLFQPLLYQVAMAGLSAPDIAQPIRSILSKHPRLEVFMDNARELDLDHNLVRCEHNVFRYDYLLLALGSLTSYFGHPEWEALAPGLKTIDDALAIRRNVLLAFERAENAIDPEEQARLMTIVIVGGGPTGVELAGSCAELAYRVLKRDFDRIDPAKARITLIEASSRVLSHLAPELSEKGQRQLEQLGVRVRTNTRVQEIQRGRITLSTGEHMDAENIIWAAGVMAHPITRTLHVPLDRAGRVIVAPDLSIPGHPNVFVIGDLAAIASDGHPVPGVAPAAMQMGRFVSSVLNSRIDSPDKPFETFRYRDKGTLATIGRSRGVAQFGKLKLSGFVAWMAWLLVHIVFLIGFRNRVSVMISWIYGYFSYNLGARIITGVSAQQSQDERSVSRDAKAAA